MKVEIPKFLQGESLPWNEWIRYKGEDFFACVNWEKSIAAHRPIIDLGNCVTKLFNGCVLRSVNFDTKHFTKSHLA